MASYIPFDIQTKILKKLLIKSLIQFRSVSKQWKSLIDSSEFITDYYIQNTHPQYLLLSNIVAYRFPRMSRKLLSNNPRIISSSQGLSCVDYYNRMKYAILWNPRTKKAVAINVSNVGYSAYKTVVGFGVCPHTRAPMIVKISCARKSSIFFGLLSLIDWQVEVFTKSSGTWKNPSTNVLRKSIIGGVSYWLAFDGKIASAEFEWYDLIMSIDMFSDEFTKFSNQYSLKTEGLDIGLFISRLRDSFPCQRLLWVAKQAYSVPMAEYWIPKSMKREFAVSNRPYAQIRNVYASMKNGEPIDVMRDYHFIRSALFVYKQRSRRIKSIRIYGKTYSYFGYRENEHVFLLDH